MITTAPGKLILTGEYAVLDGAPALVAAMNRRVVARRGGPRGSSAFLLAVTNEVVRRLGKDHPAARASLEITVDSRALYDGAQKLGLGSSAAVTVAATARALVAEHDAIPTVDRVLVLAIASAAHAAAQAARGARGSGADVAAAVFGGVLAYQRERPELIAWPSDAAASGDAVEVTGTTLERLAWPAGLVMIPFFTGASADTPTLIAQVQAARERDHVAVDAALAAIDKASRAACQACAVKTSEIASNALLAALRLAGHAMDQLAAATGLALVPARVKAAREQLARLGGTAKTTGAGGGDVGIAVIPRLEDVTEARRYLIESGCQPLNLTVDTTGVDLQPDRQ